MLQVFQDKKKMYIPKGFYLKYFNISIITYRL